MDDGIRQLDPDNQTDLENTIRLHCELLPTSPVSRLGATFMRRFYYSKLVRDSLLHCNLYYHQDHPAGFIAFTDHSTDFISRGIRRHWFFMLGVLVEMVLRNPQTLGVLISVMSSLRKRDRVVGQEISGELLSFGVLPEYRSSKFTRETDVRISLELFESAKAHFQQTRMRAFHGMVDAKNRETLLFYHSLGCQLNKLPGSDGQTVEIVYIFPE